MAQYALNLFGSSIEELKALSAQLDQYLAAPQNGAALLKQLSPLGINTPEDVRALRDQIAKYLKQFSA